MKVKNVSVFYCSSYPSHLIELGSRRIYLQLRVTVHSNCIFPGTTCTLHFTSTTPQSLNLYMDDVPGDWWSIQKIYMGLQYRYDVSYNGVYVEPPNFVKSEGKYLRNPDNDPTFYYPKSTGGAGANYFDVERKELHVLIKGSGVINIALTPQIILAATFEVISEEDFFGKNIISNLANFLNIDASKIKIMDIISESNRRRRSVRHKRNAAGISVTFMIGNNAPGTSSVGSTDISTADLIDMSKSMILKSQVKYIVMVIHFSHQWIL